MPSNDLVLNVRQIAGYPPTSSAPPAGSLLVQIAGLGSAYASISPPDLVSTALAFPGANMSIGGMLGAQTVQAGSAQFSNLAVNLLAAQKARVVEFDATYGSINGLPIATQADVAASVTGFNGRTGAVSLWLQDILNAGGAPNFSPVFGGEPRAPTPPPWSCNSQLATTKFAQRLFVDGVNNLLEDHPFVFSFNGRTGDVTLQPSDVQGAEAALLNSPPLTGTPTAPTAPPLTDTDQLATTAFVTGAVADQAAITASGFAELSTIYAPINSPAFTGYATATTQAPGTSNGTLATTAFVQAAIVESTTGVSTWNGRTGAVTLQSTDITAAGGALLVSPAFTGTPTAPTAALGSTSSQIATCAWVMNELGNATVGVMSFNGRGGAVTLLSADITGAGGALLNSPGLSGVPTAPTAAAGTNSDQIATTAFVASMVNAGAVTSFNGRTGAVTLGVNDVSAAGGLTNPSPNLTGTPTAPTASQGTSTTQLATTAFVNAALAGAVGVSSFNSRTGAVTLNSTDVNAAGAGGPYVSQAGPSTINLATINQPVVMGVTNGLNAPAGAIGEVISSVITTNIAPPNGGVVNVTSITLTPGDWDVQAEIWFAPVSGTMTGAAASITQTSGSAAALAMNTARVLLQQPSMTAGNVLALAPAWINIAAAAVIYLTCSVNYTSGSVNVTGKIWARRRR